MEQKIDIKELKAVLLETSDIYRKETARLPILPPIYAGAFKVLNIMFKWIHDIEKQNIQGDKIMDELKDKLSFEVVTMDKLPSKDQPSPVKDFILDMVKELNTLIEKESKKANPQQVVLRVNAKNPAAFTTKISQLRHNGEIDSRITTMRNKGKLYLIRKEKPVSRKSYHSSNQMEA